MKPTPSLTKGIPLFAGLTDSQHERICRAASVDDYEVGARFYTEHLPMNPAFLLMLAGGIQISRLSPSGKESILRLIRPGEIFGAVAVDAAGFFNQELHPAPTTATVIQRATVFTMDRDDMLALIQDDPSITMRMLVSVSERLVFLQESFHAAISERAKVRLARQILYHMGEFPPPVGPFTLPTLLPHQILSRLAGITYEESVRIIRTLSSQGVLGYHRGGRIIIQDMAALMATARGDDELEPIAKG